MHFQRPGVTAARVQDPKTDRDDPVGESPESESVIAGRQGRLILERRRHRPVEHSWPEALDNVHRHLLGFEAVNRELQESEKRYRTIFEEAPVGMFQMSRGGQLLDLNGAMARILGFDSAGEVLAENFGTGYSSLGYLKHFKVNRLKIAHSFIKDIPVDADDAAITIAIIEMARALNLAVPAEGVEKADQLSFLRKQECYTIQGFYFSRPASVDKAGELLRTGFEHLI